MALLRCNSDVITTRPFPPDSMVFIMFTELCDQHHDSRASRRSEEAPISRRAPVPAPTAPHTHPQTGRLLTCARGVSAIRPLLTSRVGERDRAARGSPRRASSAWRDPSTSRRLPAPLSLAPVGHLPAPPFTSSSSVGRWTFASFPFPPIVNHAARGTRAGACLHSLGRMRSAGG